MLTAAVCALCACCLLQVRDDNLAFVQTCWTFINSDSLLTWAQKVGLDFHFAVEQRARSFLGHFFNFNGTAGRREGWVCCLSPCLCHSVLGLYTTCSLQPGGVCVQRYQ